MNKRIKFSFIIYAMLTSLYAHEEKSNLHSMREIELNKNKNKIEEIKSVDKLRKIFTNAKLSAEIKSIYVGVNTGETGVDNTYATAVGGRLKYELAKLNGFNGGVAFLTSHDISSLTGNGAKQNSDLSSKNGSYTELSEAYLNYNQGAFNLRAGRQVIDTPLADSDNIRVVFNTFEAYILTYKLDNLEFMLGSLESWQGYDSGLDNSWSKTGENGTYLGGISYNNILELDIWYYNITKNTDAFYIDGGINYQFINGYNIHAMLQYLNESELGSSNIEANIYGAMLEIGIDNLSFNFAYNKSDKKRGKTSFSGFGGGTLYTSMDTMILDEITQDRDAYAFVSGVTYSYDEWEFLYAYGNFKGDKNSVKEKANIIEQDIGFEKKINNELLVRAIYANIEDKENSTKTDKDFSRLQFMISYDF